MSDPYANFVVQRAFDASQGPLRNQLVEEINSRSAVLSKFTYGRHALMHLAKVNKPNSGMDRDGKQGDHRGGKSSSFKNRGGRHNRK
jgi:hypothetical protein